jgi:hypothetical protein
MLFIIIIFWHSIHDVEYLILPREQHSGHAIQRDYFLFSTTVSYLESLACGQVLHLQVPADFPPSGSATSPSCNLMTSGGGPKTTS